MTAPPTPLGAVVAGGVLADWWKEGRPAAARLVVGGLGAVTVASGVFAVVDPTVNAPGLYVAGLFPVITGVPLALVTLTRDLVDPVRGRLTDAARRPANR